MAYRSCLKVLPQQTASVIHAKVNEQVRNDVNAWEMFVMPAEKLAEEKAQKEGLKYETDQEIAELLSRWHYQQVVIPSITEPEVDFDPMDETQVDLTGLPNGPEPTQPVEEAA